MTLTRNKKILLGFFANKIGQYQVTRYINSRNAQCLVH